MKQDKYELKSALEDYKRRLRLAQKSTELLETELKKAQREFARMKQLYEAKISCRSCISGCHISEETGRACNPI